MSSQVIRSGLWAGAEEKRLLPPRWVLAILSPEPSANILTRPRLQQDAVNEHIRVTVQRLVTDLSRCKNSTLLVLLATSPGNLQEAYMCLLANFSPSMDRCQARASFYLQRTERTCTRPPLPKSNLALRALQDIKGGARKRGLPELDGGESVTFVACIPAIGENAAVGVCHRWHAALPKRAQTSCLSFRDAPGALGLSRPSRDERDSC